LAESFKETETVDLNCPVEVVEHSIEAGNSVTATTATIGFRNLSVKKIKALRLRIFCFDPFGEPVKHQGDNILEKNLLDLTIPHKQLFGKDSPVEMKNFNDTRKIKVLVTSVLFSDDTRWDYDGTAVYEIEKAVLRKEQLARLKEAAGDDAVCYARQEEAFWQCVCGRANLAGALKCLRCGREKANTFKHLVSVGSIKTLLEMRREEEEKKIQEQANKLAEAKEQKHQKKLHFKKTAKKVVLVALSSLFIFGLISLFYGEDEDIDSGDSFIEEASQGSSEFERETSDLTSISALDAVYYIDYNNGTTPIGDLPVGTRVVDPSWEWEYRLGVNYSDQDWDGEPTPPGEIKPIKWIVVARDHYDLEEGHVTLLSEELIGLFAFDDSSDRNPEGSIKGYSHWGESGTGNASHGLRPWLNSTGIHSSEGFYLNISENFKEAVLTTLVPNKDSYGNAYSTSDKVFIPSTTELGDGEHKNTYRIGNTYDFFADNDNLKRAATLSGITKFYWTRSPSDFNMRLGGRVSEFYRDSASNGRHGVRPALNLKADTLVSEIGN